MHTLSRTGTICFAISFYQRNLRIYFKYMNIEKKHLIRVFLYMNTVKKSLKIFHESLKKFST